MEGQRNKACTTNIQEPEKYRLIKELQKKITNNLQFKIVFKKIVKLTRFCLVLLMTAPFWRVILHVIFVCEKKFVKSIRLTQISNLLVRGVPEYNSTISGDRYESVVYFLISSSTEVIPILLESRILAVAEPKSQSTKLPLSSFKMFSTLRSRWIIGVWQWCNRETALQISQNIFKTSSWLNPESKRSFIIWRTVHLWYGIKSKTSWMPPSKRVTLESTYPMRLGWPFKFDWNCKKKINVVLDEFSYKTYNYGDFSLANSQILIIVDKNAFQCIFLVTIGRRLGFASFDMTSD